MEATTYQRFRLYGQLVEKKRMLLLHIQFLTRCRRRNLIPKFINVKSSTNSAASKIATNSAKKIWLIEEIRTKHKEVSIVEEKLYSLHLQLLKLVEYHSAAECVVFGCMEKIKKCWQQVLCGVQRNLRKRVKLTKQRHRKKLHCLARTQKEGEKTTRSPQMIDNFVINLSSIQFTREELHLFNKGLNFAILPVSAPIADVVNNIESAIQYQCHSIKSAVRLDVEKCISRSINSQNKSRNIDFDTWCVVRRLKSREVVYSRADKGNAIVIMDNSDYDSRFSDMINSGPYEECKYKNGKPRDPLNTMVEQANITRRQVAHLMGEEKLDRKLHVPNPKVASLYWLPKVHKNPLAMRPISSNICTPTEKMAAWLVDELRKYPVTQGKSVKNSVELVK
ncbi:uncharacterized protein LOC129717070 [Wyeomyia smithii]|uniref:uncharacterized protein LOC129717070 n=1 Tax=Wyeomyia smithii TaxID=174621 RepID=UPI002467D7F8|nr:uncharacterized protein LOC129717070 [Wyeomyia smithii]